MVSEHPHFLLKILSGPHIGAELDLAGGTYVIGSDLECDLILLDAMVTPRQLSLSIEKGVITLEPIEGKTYLSGHPLEGKTEHVPMYAFITVGSTHMMLGEVGRPWPKISLEGAPSLVAGKEGEQTEAGSEAPKQLKEAVGKPISTVIKPLIPRSLKILFYSAITLLLLVIIVSAYHAIQGAKVAQENRLEQKISYIKAALYSYNKDESIDVKVANDVISIVGYVDTNEQYVAIQNAMYKIDPNIKIDIYSIQAIIEQINSIFNGLNIVLNVKSLEKGNVEVSGYCFIAERWQSAKAYIKLHVPGLQEVVDHVVDGVFVNKIVQDVLWQQGLSSFISFSVTPLEINVSGLVNNATYDQWKGAEHVINERLYKSVPIIDNIKVIIFANNEQQYFDIPIESINIKVPGYIVFHNGARYFEGTTLPNGYMIKEISEKGIILTQANNEVIIKLDQL